MDLPSHQLSMTVLMTPDMANFSGNVHGGTILKFLDQVAYACASRYAGRYVVTLSVDPVMFRQPIHVGELVSFLAAVPTATLGSEVTLWGRGPGSGGPVLSIDEVARAAATIGYELMCALAQRVPVTVV